jgi:hypothetical protein
MVGSPDREVRVGQPEHAKRSQAERIAGVIESARPTKKGVEVTLRIYLYPDGSATIRPREGFRDRGGEGVHAGVPCGKSRDRLLATIGEIIDGARP